MPLQLDKNAQAWMGTQVGEMMRKKRNEAAQSTETEINLLIKRFDQTRIESFLGSSCVLGFNLSRGRKSGAMLLYFEIQKLEVLTAKSSNFEKSKIVIGKFL